MGDFVLSISYGNYIIQNGGTDKVIREHCNMFNEVGLCYLFAFPVIRKQKLGSRLVSFRFWGLNINKKLAGLFTFNNLISEIRNYQVENQCQAVFIHHTWRIEEDELEQFFKLNEAPIYYYLHDFHAICDNNNFINGDGCFCGYGVDTFECDRKCHHYETSAKNRNLFKHFLKDNEDRLCCIAPSENTKHIYVESFPEYKRNFVSVKHQKANNYRNIVSQEENPLKVAFIGAQTYIKGWDDFKVTINGLKNKDIELYYLGMGNDILPGVKPIKVSVREQGDSAMQDALQANKIDVVLLLSCCPETYSYTFYESYSAGCFVITYKCSGNIADQVVKKQCGKVCENLSELLNYIQHTENLKNDVYKYKRYGGKVPGQLVPNDQIVKMLNISASKEVAALDIGRFNHRACVAELIYRLQNRRRYNGVKK